MPLIFPSIGMQVEIHWNDTGVSTGNCWENKCLVFHWCEWNASIFPLASHQGLHCLPLMKQFLDHQQIAEWSF